MPLRPDRRSFLVLSATAALALALPGAAVAEPVVGDMTLGDPKAPVTVIEYASLTCPHCAAFHRENWARLKSEYIDTGKVHFIFRDVYFDRYGLWAAMTARCGGQEAFFPIVGHFFEKQPEWTGVPQDQIGAEIMKIGRLNGLTNEQLRACLSDEGFARRLIEDYQKKAGEHEVTSTPTFIINGEKYTGNMPWEEFSRLIEQHLGAG